MQHAVADDRLIAVEGRKAGEQHHLRDHHREDAEFGDAEAPRGERERRKLHRAGGRLAAEQKARIARSAAQDAPARLTRHRDSPCSAACVNNAML